MAKQPSPSEFLSASGVPPDALGPAATSDNSADSNPAQLNLANHFLVAMPTMLDPIFGGAVIFLCEHNANGALGVVINKPTDMTMEMLFERVDLKLEITPSREQFPALPVMFGGPVQVERGFVLHSPAQQFSSTLEVSPEVALTTSKDVLEAVAHGDGPLRMLVSLGCSGWSAGQLEEELGRNGWLTVPADPAIIFEMPVEERFNAALQLLGIDPIMLTAESGHA